MKLRTVSLLGIKHKLLDKCVGDMYKNVNCSFDLNGKKLETI